MAGINLARLDLRDYATIRVKLHGEKVFRLRLKIALLFIRIGVFISGCGFQYDGIDDDAAMD